MQAEKKRFRINKESFLFFKIILWICTGFVFISFSILIPTTSYNTIKELIVFISLFIVVNIHTSFLYQIVSKKSKLLYGLLLISSVLICAIIETLLFSKSFFDVYSFLDRRTWIFLMFFYITIRDFALFTFFFWVEFFNRIFLLYQEKEKIHKQEITLLVEKQEFEKKISRKKLFPHYFFNILEHIGIKSLTNHNDNELMNKIKFVLYYFLVDAEMEKIDLEKELIFYKYYIELEKLRHQKNISVNFDILGQPDHYEIIPLLFEPLIGNALKYTNHDGSGWVDISVDVQQFPVLKFQCRNNYSRHTSNTMSSENGLKILEQRLYLCYKNKHTLKITQNDDLYEVVLSVKVV